MVKVSRNDGKYYLTIDDQAPVKLEVKQPKGWDPTIMLPDNPTKRKLLNEASFNKKCDAQGVDEIELTIKTPVSHTGGGNRAIPNKKVAEWYRDNVEGGQALYNEYMAIVNTAIQAMNDAKAKPMTELEKAEAKAKRAREAYEKLLAQAAGKTTDTAPVEYTGKKNKKEGK